MLDDFDIPDWVSERGGTQTVPRPDAPSVHGAPHRPTAPGQASHLAEPRPRPQPALDPPSQSRRDTGARSAVRRASPGRHRPPLPSRKVRLRRTALGATLVVAFVATIVSLWSPTQAAVRARAASPTTAGSSSTGATPSQTRTGATAAAQVTLQGKVTATPVVDRGTGGLHYVPLPAVKDTAPSGARTVRVALEVEGGTHVDEAQAATWIAAVLGHQKGWQGTDRVRFRPVTAAQVARGEVDIRITLASPTLTDKLCAPLQTHGHVSCFNKGRAVLNTKRWLTGVPSYKGKLPAYHTYLVNHEVGHGLGHGHEDCPGAGRVAPIMLQQTLGLHGCIANPYPRP